MRRVLQTVEQFDDQLRLEVHAYRIPLLLLVLLELGQRFDGCEQFGLAHRLKVVRIRRVRHVVYLEITRRTHNTKKNKYDFWRHFDRLGPTLRRNAYHHAALQSVRLGHAQYLVDGNAVSAVLAERGQNGDRVLDEQILFVRTLRVK